MWLYTSSYALLIGSYTFSAALENTFILSMDQMMMMWGVVVNPQTIITNSAVSLDSMTLLTSFKLIFLVLPVRTLHSCTLLKSFPAAGGSCVRWKGSDKASVHCHRSRQTELETCWWTWTAGDFSKELVTTKFPWKWAWSYWCGTCP